MPDVGEAENKATSGVAVVVVVVGEVVTAVVAVVVGEVVTAVVAVVVGVGVAVVLPSAATGIMTRAKHASTMQAVKAMKRIFTGHHLPACSFSTPYTVILQVMFFRPVCDNAPHVIVPDWGSHPTNQGDKTGLVAASFCKI